MHSYSEEPTGRRTTATTLHAPRSGKMQTPCYGFGFLGQHQLFVRKLNIQSDTPIAHMKSIFEEHGIPSKLVTGNDIQFTSALFQEFRETYGFNHVTTSPYYPQANGFREKRTDCKEPTPEMQRIRCGSSPCHVMHKLNYYLWCI